MADLIYRRDAYDVVYKEHCGICVGAILDIPKVEAIPIEWLRKVMLNDVNDEISSEAASRVMELWQKEQEG